MAQAIAKQIAARIEGSGVDRWWRPADLSDLPADSKTIDRVLARMADAGKLRRIRRGTYWHGSQTRFGMTFPDEITLAMHIAGSRGVGPAGMTAANDLGLTTQVPGTLTIAVPRRAPRPLMTMRFVDRSGRVGRVLSDLSWMEVAVLEVLGDWHQVIELDDMTAMQKLAQAINSGDIRKANLLAAADYEPLAVRKRLDEILSLVAPEAESETVPL